MTWVTEMVERICKAVARSESESNPLDQICSVSEAALMLGKGGRKVRRMIERGELDARKSGGVWLVRVEGRNDDPTG